MTVFSYLGYNIVILYFSLDIFISASYETCPYIEPSSRIKCNSFSKDKCSEKGCCWDENEDIHCYEKACKSGTFGFGCRFKCTCTNRGGCDAVTGECEASCAAGRWGVGCMLEDQCTYNDDAGTHYMGGLSRTERGEACRSWRNQRAYSDADFPDQDLRAVRNQCRNPQPADFRPWCYYVVGPKPSDRKFGYCSLAACECPVGRWGVNCVHECHCNDASEYCDQRNGRCRSGCALGWTGSGCQECAAGWFGRACAGTCHCLMEEDEQVKDVCDASTGSCRHGCAPGWLGPSCQQECSDRWFGVNCDLQCICQDEYEACDKQTGECRSGCYQGYAGEGCQLAIPKHVIQNTPGVVRARPARAIACHCAQQSACAKDTCVGGCQPGWVGQLCHTEVPRITTAPRLASRSANSFTVRWNRWRKPPDRGDGPVVGYLVSYYAWEDRNDKGTKRTNMTTTTLRDLHNNTRYAVQVAPIHEQNFIGIESPILNVTTCGVPEAGVSNLEVKAVTDRSSNQVTLTVTWEFDVSLAGCRRIQHFLVYTRGTDEDDQFELYSETDNNRIVIQELSPYSSLDIAVSYMNDAGFESAKTIHTLIGKSGPVRDVEMAPSTHSVTITWSPPENPNSDITLYIVRYRRLRQGNCEGKFGSWQPMEEVPATETSYVLSGLQPYSLYTVKVWVRTERHNKGQQVSHNVTTLATVPSEQVGNLIVKERTATHLSVSWEAPPCKTHNGRPVGYNVRLVHDTDDVGIVMDERVVNATTVSFSAPLLVPYENYTLSVAFQNHMGLGEQKRISVQMLQSTPPAPGLVHIKSPRLSDQLTLSWQQPDPPHGVITQYEVKHWTPLNVGSPTHVEVNADQTNFTLRGLKPNKSFLFQVRAFTSIGPGSWAAAVDGATEESEPSPPENVRNVSRTETSLTLAWDPPTQPNGEIKGYQVVCMVARARDRFKTTQFPKEVSGSQRSATLTGLHSGTDYMCHVWARTSKGPGDRRSAFFFTLPEKPSVPAMPRVELAETTDTTITLVLPPTPYNNPNVETAMVMNRLIVQRTTTDTRRWRRSAPSDTPCGHTHAQLSGYEQATRDGVPCYVTAALTKLSKEHIFVIGDNQTVGGYYNAPLTKGEEYVVWLEVSVTVDGETRASYTRITPVQAKLWTGGSTQQGATGTASVVAGVVVATLTASVCVFIIIIFIIKRKKLSGNGYQHAMRTESEHISSSPKASSHHEKSSTADVYMQSTDSEAEGEEGDPLHPKHATPRPPIKVEDLWNYVRYRKITNSTAFKQEYDEIPMGLTAHCEHARRPDNKNKNRYGNIVAYDHSRVNLDPLPDQPNSDYINANYIDAYRRPNQWIATQGPSKQTFHDMWRLVWQKHVHRIIMVTNLIEDGRHKCEQYWPDAEPRTYGDIHVEKLEEEQYADFTIRTFNVTAGDDTRIVRQFHFTAWPDHGCPIYATSLIAFRKKVRSYDDPTTGPTVVHCSAGVGRTGTFIALDYLLDMAKAEQQVDVYSFVQYMRTKRVNMVQTQEQYEFVYEALLEALKSGDTAIPCVDFRKRYLDLQKENPDTNKVRLAEEFELLSMLSMNPPNQAGCMCALDQENIGKNRNPDIIPLDNMQRPFLMTYIPGSSDYINAVFTDGYKHRDAFIITQMPLPHTLTDLWAMIYDHECSAIVMMNELIPSDPTCACYYPMQAGSIQHGPFTIETVVLDSTFPDITIRDVTLTSNKKASEPRSVRQFQFHGWPTDQPLPLRRSSVIQLLQLVEKWQQRSGNKTIVVHCMDGASRSGLLCAISYMIERLKVEQEVDVFNSVKHTRINRPQLVPTLEQYQYIYDMAEEYMDCFETYANFK